LVNPYSEKQIYEAILHLVEDENKREQLIDMGLKNIKKFSWEEIPQPESVSLTSLEVAV
jgi:hypothetical protein